MGDVIRFDLHKKCDLCNRAMGNNILKSSYHLCNICMDNPAMYFKVLDGFIQDEQFVLRGILKHTVYGTYKAEGLYQLAMVIGINEPFNFTIDEAKKVYIDKENAIQLRKELLIMADYIEEYKG